jgi:hypothetical protein
MIMMISCLCSAAGDQNGGKKSVSHQLSRPEKLYSRLTRNYASALSTVSTQRAPA